MLELAAASMAAVSRSARAALESEGGRVESELEGVESGELERSVFLYMSPARR